MFKESPVPASHRTSNPLCLAHRHGLYESSHLLDAHTCPNGNSRIALAQILEGTNAIIFNLMPENSVTWK